MSSLAHVVLGQGLTAQSTARYLLKHQLPVRIFSLRPNCLPQDLLHLYTRSSSNAIQYWVSPGIAPESPLWECLLPSVPKMLDIEDYLLHTTAKVIGVTGTNGKSSVCCYLASFLREKGYKCGVYGNYAAGLLHALDEDLDWVIIELSSFQLHYLPAQSQFEAIAITNVDVDHISWHRGIVPYQQTKLKAKQLSSCCISYDIPGTVSYASRVHEVQCTNGIEAKNIACALQVLASLGMSFEWKSSLPKLPFRLQKISDHPVIYNDSKATNLHATYAALQTVLAAHQNVCLMMAGISKGESPQALLKLIESEKVKLIIIGQAHLELDHVAACRVQSIEEGFNQVDLSTTILFSPGGSSYDQYEDYLARGRHFDRVVQNKMARP